ncbi:MAG: glycosyl transferase [Rhizobiales bacterium 62-47]|nr:glycosyltransferase family 4 protein [Hyphomicrobiales bacterium]OJY09523.1 MAG: glycosyl transferase [Rhizobiales bacterium 62-47]
MTASHVLAALGTLSLAGLISFALTRAIRPVLIRYLLAKPNARSSHSIPTPQGGGFAVVGATLIAGGLASAIIMPQTWTSLAIVFAAVVFIAAVGALDDFRSLPVAARLLCQALAIGAVLLVAPSSMRISPEIPVWIERGLLLLAGIWFVNLVNFMDGLDLMTASEAVPITGALVLFGLTGVLPPATTLLAAALCGAMLGFAPFNRPIAKIFLGDVGSLPIGLLLGWMLLDLAYQHQLAAALILPLYYLADATTTLIRRAMNREPVWQAHRSHFYQRATDNGFSVTRVVTNVFCTNIVLAGLAGVSAYFRSGLVDIIALVAATALVTTLMVRFSTPQR